MMVCLHSRVVFTALAKSCRSFSISSRNQSQAWDAIVIGGGHNGLVAAAYLAKSDKKVLVLEKRNVIGGAAVTEEIIPGFKFSRASYLKSLFRMDIEEDLQLKKHGLVVYQRNPSSFTPSLVDKEGRGLVIGMSEEENHKQLSQFSEKDAVAYPIYEKWLTAVADTFEPLFDDIPIDPLSKNVTTEMKSRLKFKYQDMESLTKLLLRSSNILGPKQIPSAIELLTAPVTKIMDRWFESDILKGTLSTDAVIGALTSPSQPQSGYVLLHHVMGQAELGAARGTWGYVQGGMGGLSQAIANSAESEGVEIRTSQNVSHIRLDKDGNACGVTLDDGSLLDSKIVLSNCTPKITFCELIKKEDADFIPESFQQGIDKSDYSSATFKINVALSGLPKFKSKVLPYANSNPTLEGPPELQGTIHINSESMDLLEEAFADTSKNNLPSRRPVIELTIPSVLDPTLAPKGSHVMTMFVQYAPFNPTVDKVKENGEPYENGWDCPGVEQAFIDRVFSCVEDYAPGFKNLIIGVDALSPITLERELSLTGGNIFHGAMGLDQLYAFRPQPGWSRHSTPIKNLFLCGSGTHPGGGCTGAPGRNCSRTILTSNAI